MLSARWMKEIPYLILIIMMTGFLLTHSPNLDYDSIYYINFDASRPLLYPFFIWLFKWEESINLP